MTDTLAAPDRPTQKAKAKAVDSLFSWLGIRLQPPGGRKEKTLAASAAFILMVGGSIADRAMGGMLDTIFPDPAQQRAQALQESISNKVTNIDEVSKSISAKLAGMDSELSASVKADTDRLMAAIATLQPDLNSAGKIGGDAERLYAEAKQNEIKRQGFSTSSDFVVPSGQGATVCPEGYIFGMRATGGTSVIANLSGGGTKTGLTLEPGESLVLKDADGKAIQVGYQGKVGEEKDARYGFSVICPK